GLQPRARYTPVSDPPDRDPCRPPSLRESRRGARGSWYPARGATDQPPLLLGVAAPPVGRTVRSGSPDAEEFAARAALPARTAPLAPPARPRIPPCSRTARAGNGA